MSQSNASGTSGSFTFRFADSGGVSNLVSVDMEFGPQSIAINQTPASTCRVTYSPRLNVFSLIDDTGLLGSAGAPGSIGSAQNSRCILDFSRSTAVSGDDLAVTLALSFPPAVTGPQPIWMRAMENSIAAGFQKVGTFTVTRPGTCSATFAPALWVDAAAQTVAIPVAADAGCSWSFTTGADWITINSGPLTGTGTASVGLAANLTNAARTGLLAVGGNILTLTQARTRTTFADVPVTNLFFDAINLLSERHITDGCVASPPSFCPSDAIPRGQAAVFIVRSVMGDDNFSFTPAPYFDDVPVTHMFFKWIQKMRDLGITRGCRETAYCPDAEITRGEMAVFVIRARFGSSDPFQFLYTPFFSDVGPAFAFFPWIQEMKQIGITSGCDVSRYCPDASVTRGEMATFIMRGAFNQLLPDPAPVILSVVPATASPGQTVTVTISGRSTVFNQWSTAVRAGPGITVQRVTVLSVTSLTAQLVVAADAALGPRSITAVTQGQEATLPNSLWIE